MRSDKTSCSYRQLWEENLKKPMDGRTESKEFHSMESKLTEVLLLLLLLASGR